MSGLVPTLLVRFNERVPVDTLKDCLISPDNRLIALRSSENAVTLFSLVERSNVNGFKATNVLFLDWISVGGRTFLVTVNSKGALVLYEYCAGQGSRGFYVRVVSKNGPEGPANDPVMARFEDSGAGDDEESVYCWDISLERLGAFVSKRDRVVAVSSLICLPRHVVLVTRGSRRENFFVFVLDVTPRMAALRRWWIVEAQGGGDESIHVDIDVAVGRKEAPGLVDLGPRALGTDAAVPDVIAAAPLKNSRMWLPPVLQGQEHQQPPATMQIPAGVLGGKAFFAKCEAGAKEVLVASDGLYLPNVDKDALLRATLIFEGPDRAFQMAQANGWDTTSIRMFALEQAFRHGDAVGAQKALADLPKDLRPKAREVALAHQTLLSWSLLQAWTAASADWAVNDGDLQAAESVKTARVNVLSGSVTEKVSATRRGLFFAEETTLGSTVEWKPQKSTRKKWEGLPDSEVARQAALSGKLSLAQAFLRWRGSSTSIIQMAKEAAYRSICKGALSEAMSMIVNIGASNVDNVLLHVWQRTLRPSVRLIVGKNITTAESLQMDDMMKVFHCSGGSVDDHSQASHWVPEEQQIESEESEDAFRKGPEDDALTRLREFAEMQQRNLSSSKPYLRASLAWLASWGQQGCRDVFLEGAIYWGAESEAQKRLCSPDDGPEWDPQNFRALSLFCRHGDERLAKKFVLACANKGILQACEGLVATALEGAVPHVKRAVLWECARHGVHPLGVDRQIACASSSMLMCEAAGIACVNAAISLKRAGLFHSLVDAGAKLPLEVSGAWADFAVASREDPVSEEKLGRLCAALLHSSLLANDSGSSTSIRNLGRPLISVPLDLYNSLVPDASQLTAIGCPNVWNSSFSAAVQNTFVLSSLVPPLPKAANGTVCVAAPSAASWMKRSMPFRAALADGREDIADFFEENFPKQHHPPCSDWLVELLESSLDPYRAVSNTVIRSVAVTVNKVKPDACGDVLPEFSSPVVLQKTFARSWKNLRLRRELLEVFDDLGQSSFSETEALELLSHSLAHQTPWDTAHLLRALDGWTPLFTSLCENWNVIKDHNLEPSLLHGTKEQIGAVLRARGLWDAWRKYDPDRRDEVTLAQAERVQPSWERVSELFESQRLSGPVKTKFWLARANDFDEKLDTVLLACAVQSSGNEELEVRLLFAEHAQCTWKKLSGCPEKEKVDILQAVCGQLAARGEIEKAKRCCKFLNVWPPVMMAAQKRGLTGDDLEPFLRNEFGSGWKHWAQGKILQIRANVDDSQSAEVVAAILAGEGQVALARDWAVHFKPDATRLSRALGARFVEAIRKQYMPGSSPAETISLASPSSRGMLTSPGIDIGWNDAAWADYVSVGGSPRDVGDVLFEALTSETTQVVRAVELCVRAYSCYAMACCVEGMDHVLVVAERLARVLADCELYQHLVRLVTGVGNYERLGFCFSLLLQVQQFELILRKNPMMSYGARVELRMALLEFLKRQHPEDSKTLNLLLLSFGMFREIGEAFEAKANDLIAQGRGQPALLLRALGFLLDAADSFHKERCLESAERVQNLANLVRLQLFRPNLRLLFENGADIGKLTIFSEAVVVARALRLAEDWWANVIYEQGIVAGNVSFLETAITTMLMSVPVATFFHTLLVHARRCGASTATLSSMVMRCPDIFLSFDLAMEFELEKVTEELASTHSAIRSFKLLKRPSYPPKQ